MKMRALRGGEMGLFTRGRKGSAENLIRALEQIYFDLKEKNPDRDEHWFLANTWLKRYSSSKQAKQKGAEWTKFVAYNDTLQFSILEPPKSIRGLALFLVYKELGEGQALRYADEYSQLMEPVILCSGTRLFFDKYKQRNPRTWKENQVEDDSSYSLYWLLKGLEFEQEHPEEAEGAWSNSELKRKTEKMEWLDMLDPNLRLDVKKDAEKIKKLEQLRAEYNIPDEVFATGITGTYWATEQLQRKLFEQGKEMAPGATDKEIFRELILARTTYRNPFGLDISMEEIDVAIKSIDSIDDLVRYILSKEDQELPWPDPLGIRGRIEEILKS